MNLRKNEKTIDWFYLVLLAGTAAFFVLIFSARKAQAVPSFARQTGLACSSCHTNPPELTPLGRTFKLNGYSMTGIKVITSPPEKERAGLSLLSYLPLSAWFEISNTGTQRPQDGTQNWSFSIPQDVSLFLAGAYATHLGGFVQATYDAQSDHFSLDNTDIRYANNRLVRGKTLVYGIDLNNNPTVEDLWNSTPTWGFPWIASPSAPTPPLPQSLTAHWDSTLRESADTPCGTITYMVRQWFIAPRTLANPCPIPGQDSISTSKELRRTGARLGSKPWEIVIWSLALTACT